MKEKEITAEPPKLGTMNDGANTSGMYPAGETKPVRDAYDDMLRGEQ